MAIETVGQQKYADLTAKRIKSLQTGMIIWISLFCLALICSFSNNLLAIIVGNMRRRMRKFRKHGKRHRIRNREKQPEFVL